MHGLSLYKITHSEKKLRAAAADKTDDRKGW